jgi:hypothetical protein
VHLGDLTNQDSGALPEVLLVPRVSGRRNFFLRNTCSIGMSRMKSAGRERSHFE